VIDFSQIQIPGTSSSEMSGLAAAAAGAQTPEDPKTLRDMILASPHDLAMLKERNPPLADALLSGSLGLWLITNNFNVQSFDAVVWATGKSSGLWKILFIILGS